MKLLPIKETIEENKEFADHPDCQESISMTIAYYKKVGFHLPWIGYYVQKNKQLVGAAGFKGAPIHGKVEIAYGTFEKYRHKGIGTEICKKLVDLSLQTDPSIEITARTLPENNFSTKILKKNGFEWNGKVMDKDDGEVWEWKYVNSTSI